MKQEDFNLIVRSVVFSLSTDCCMDSDATDGGLDALKVLISENPELVKNIDFGSLYIFGDDPKLWEDPKLNDELLSMFDGKLPYGR